MSKLFAGVMGFAALTLLATPVLAQQAPAALWQDPPADAANPAKNYPFALPSHGQRINAVLYLAAGMGPHPTLILFHGLPGNEQNLDIARTLQRAGWNVLTLHYRGSWGSLGTFSFEHCLEDGEAALAWVRQPDAAVAARMDPRRIAVAGHSLGGFVAGYVAGHAPDLMGAALFSPARFIGTDIERFSRADVLKSMNDNLKLDDGMTATVGATGASLTDESFSHARTWDLVQFAPTLAKAPLLVVTSDDGYAATSERLAATVERLPGAKVSRVHLATDHSYNDKRIALTTALLAWLDSLKDAPRHP